MSRPLRIEYPGAWYHVMNRGLNRCRIFHSDAQREAFLELLADICARYGVQTHAYCLMDNHYHLLLHTSRGDLSRAMRHLDGLYTQRFNRQEHRDGPLFRGRYKAILVEAEHYGLELSRYIHLNPVSARLCLYPEDYMWSSYRAYMGQAKRPEWLFCGEILGCCSEKPSIKNYQEFVAEGISTRLEEVFSKKHWPSVLGSERWIEELKKHCAADLAVNEEIPAAKQLMSEGPSEDIHLLMQAVVVYYGITLLALKQESGRHAENKARNAFIYLAVVYGGYPNKKIAEVIGNIRGSAVAQVKVRMQKRLVKDQSLQGELERLKQACF